MRIETRRSSFGVVNGGMLAQELTENAELTE